MPLKTKRTVGKNGSEGLPKGVLNDSIKWMLAPAKVSLDCLSLWPGQQNVPFNIFYLANMIILELSHMSYLYENITNLTEMAELISSFTFLLHGIVKMWMLIYHRKKLHLAITAVCSVFWSSKVIDKQLQVEMRQHTLYFVVLVCLYSCSGVMCCYLLMLKDLVTGSAHLPFKSVLPFDYTQRPLYEVLFIWQIFFAFSNVLLLTGFNLLFISLTWSCTAHMSAIKIALTSLVQKAHQASSLRQLVSKIDYKRREMLFLRKCIEHHQCVLENCNRLEDIYSFVVLFMLLNGIFALCAAAFVTNVVPEKTGAMVAFCLAHLFQFYTYAHLGSELNSQSIAISDAAFHCGWHLVDNIELRKNVIFLITRSQRGQRITAGGFVDLNFDALSMLLRTAFSFYTLLNTLLEKRSAE